MIEINKKNFPKRKYTTLFDMSNDKEKKKKLQDKNKCLVCDKMIKIVDLTSHAVSTYKLFCICPSCISEIDKFYNSTYRTPIYVNS